MNIKKTNQLLIKRYCFVNYKGQPWGVDGITPLFISKIHYQSYLEDNPDMFNFIMISEVFVTKKFAEENTLKSRNYLIED